MRGGGDVPAAELDVLLEELPEVGADPLSALKRSNIERTIHEFAKLGLRLQVPVDVGE